MRNCYADPNGRFVRRSGRSGYAEAGPVSCLSFCRAGFAICGMNRCTFVRERCVTDTIFVKLPPLGRKGSNQVEAVTSEGLAHISDRIARPPRPALD